MQHKRLFIISGCNGAGKTTASFNILPDILNCREYVNADEIARGISPFQPEKVSFEAGRIMLQRIEELLSNGESFAFETTLATKSFKNLVARAKAKGYFVSLIYFWLESTDLAEQRVKIRVQEGGHNIPEDVIIRRYYAGLKNLTTIYQQICDIVLVYDNSRSIPVLIYEKSESADIQVHDPNRYNILRSMI